jgi:hypothetical protein
MKPRSAIKSDLFAADPPRPLDGEVYAETDPKTALILILTPENISFSDYP